jgi:hypothetical protein
MAEKIKGKKKLRKGNMRIPEYFSFGKKEGLIH